MVPSIGERTESSSRKRTQTRAILDVSSRILSTAPLGQIHEADLTCTQEKGTLRSHFDVSITGKAAGSTTPPRLRESSFPQRKITALWLKEQTQGQ